MTVLASRPFWTATVERAVKTGAQAAILALGQDVASFDVFAASWGNITGFAVGGAILSVLTSLASLKVGPADTPSVV